MITRRTLVLNGLALGSSGFLGAGLSGAAGLSAPAAGEDSLTVAVLGATGRTGRFVVEELLARGHAVRGISRSAGGRPPRDGVSWISADVRQPETLRPALENVDALIYAVGVNFFEVEADALYEVYHTGVADAADLSGKAGVKRFVLLSSAGRSPASSMPEELRPSMDAKAKGEAALRASGIDYTISRTSGLWDRPGGEYGILFLQTETIPPGGPYMICREDSASVLVECAVTEKAVNKTFAVLNAVTFRVGAWREALPHLREDPA